MVEAALFWGKGFGILTIPVCLYLLAPILVPIIMLVPGQNPENATDRPYFYAFLAALAYAVPGSWLGGPGIIYAIPFLVFAPIVSLYALVYMKRSRLSKRAVLLLVLPFLVSLVFHLLPSRGAMVG